jgi:hypothetical protein
MRVHSSFDLDALYIPHIYAPSCRVCRRGILSPGGDSRLGGAQALAQLRQHAADFGHVPVQCAQLCFTWR